MIANMKRFLLFLILIAFALLLFWLGKQFGSKNVNQEILSNSLIVKEIAELASLEVQGSATTKQSNVVDDGTWMNNMKKAFVENTVWVTVPYVAKYGVDVDSTNFKVEISDKKIVVRLPEPKLLSYELRVDRMETANRKGWLLFSNDETYTGVQKKLYTESRGQLEGNKLYINQSKEKVVKIIREYYKPWLKDHELVVEFGGAKMPLLN
ncbi:Protein of unknown function [Chitinophaga sancti]|uniref:DUF4230 domain-containing protein n=2 Tax=Chitinophaga sancti TaxID=1004 RepID=A0A1K1QTN8_9BACT|nr:Protein of unknown function [Chitinophaga sancti]